MLGSQCESACELVSRVLQTYASATVIGSIKTRVGRLDRDAPAVLTLPASKTDVYFLAHQYLLSKEIEKVTGPTASWNAGSRDAESGLVAYAVKELKERASRKKAWPKDCRSLRDYPSPSAMPGRYRKKIHNYSSFDFCAEQQGVDLSVRLRSKAPASVLQRIASTCGIPSLTVSRNPTGGHLLSADSAKNRARAIIRLAQSAVVDHIYVRCEPRPTLDSR